MKNKFIKILLCILLLLTFCSILIKKIDIVNADSGWDTSYDSGGSSSGGSSWHGSSSSSSGSGTEIDAPTFLLIIIIIIVGIIIKNMKDIKNESNKKEYFSSKEILYNKERLKRREKYLAKETTNYLNPLKINNIIPNFNIEEFNIKAYQIFYDVQMAWMDFEYSKLKELVTDELYNSYVMQLDALKLKNQKNVMSNFELVESYIYELKEENGLYIAKVYLDVEFLDYIEDIKTRKVLRGNEKRKIKNTYILTFICSKEKATDINKCPRCGAKVEGNVTGTCKYCGSKLMNKNYDWVMSKKEKINQR